MTEVTGPSEAGVRRQTITVPRGKVPANQDVSRARPLARRDFNTLRPFRVDILARKPWVRARFKRLGWNVCFMTLYPRRKRGREHHAGSLEKDVGLYFSAMRRSTRYGCFRISVCG